MISLSSICLIWAEKSNEINEEILSSKRSIFPVVGFSHPTQLCLGDTVLDVSSKINSLEMNDIMNEWIKVNDSLFRFQFQNNHLVAWAEKKIVDYPSKLELISLEEDIISKKLTLSDNNQIIMKIFSYAEIETFHFI